MDLIGFGIAFLIAGIGLSIAALCEKKTKGKAGIVLLIIIMCFSIKALWSHMGNSNNSSEEKCQVCYKIFTNKDDVHSIIMTNMCEKCYGNFKYTQDLKEELKKEERYED
ncbi:hypothetical protein AALC25_02045 [Lachnospiraceae bacterium 29-84]